MITREHVRILLIEDNADYERLISGILAESQTPACTVDCADNLEDGVRQLASNEFDVVLLDIGLADCAGVEAVRLLLRNARSMPAVVALGDLDDEDIAVRSTQFGAQDYLVKGQIDNTSLTRSIRCVLERNEADKALRLTEAHLEHCVANRITQLCETVQTLERSIEECRAAESSMASKLAAGKTPAELAEAIIAPEAEIDAIGGLVLDCAKRLTDSEYGSVIVMSSANADLGPHTLIGTPDAGCQVVDPEQRLGLRRGPDGRFLSLWGYTLNTKQGFYTNSPEMHEASTGIPEGHIPVRNFLAVPVMLGGCSAGEIALANARHDYSDRDLAAIERLAHLFAIAVGRTRSEEAQRERDQRFRSITDGSPIPTFAIDENHRVIAWNHALQEYSGIPAEEVLETSDQWRAFYPTERPCMADLVLDGKVDQIPLWYEGKWACSPMVSGAYEAVDFFPHMREGRWLYFTAAALCDTDGRVVGAVETLQDITEQKRAQASVQQSEERFRKLLSQAADGIFLITDEGTILDVNEAACSSLGYARDELLRLNIADIDKDVKSHQEKVRAWEMLHPGEAATFEGVHRRKDGSTLPVEVRLGTLKLDGQRVLLGLARDISQRKQAEEAMRESNRMLETLVANLPGFVYRCDNDRQRTTRYLGGRFKEVTGHVPEDVIENRRLSFNDIITWDQREAVWLTFQDHLSRKESVQIEYTIRTADGSIRWVWEHGRGVFDDRGQLLALEGFICDITERKRTDLALRKAEIDLLDRQRRERELVEAELAGARDELIRTSHLAALGQLTGSVAHEIRNPLGTIRSSVYVIDRALDTKTPIVAKHIERIEANITRCDAIIEELLDYVRVRRIRPAPTELDSLIGHVLDEQTMPSGVEVIRQLDSNATLLLDTERIQKCLMNVFSNACSAMTDDQETRGRLVVESSRLEDRVEIRISDSGTGIADEDLPRVFEPLFSTKTFGVGLGLAIVKQTMERHHGGVEIVSGAGIGTTVTLWFPSPSGP